MASFQPLLFKLPSDFVQRCSATSTRVADGEAMTMQYLADALGLPFEFLAAASAIAGALACGHPVIIDPAPLAKPN
jgi:hypothetical protein